MVSDQRSMRLLLLIQLISMGAMEMSGPFWPLQIQALLAPEDLHYSGVLSALVYAGPMLAAMIFTPAWGRLGDRVGHRWMLIRALGALALCQGLAAWLTDPWALMMTRVLQGALGGFIAAAQAYALCLHSGHDRGRIMGQLQSATALGSLLGPVLGGALMQAYGFVWLCHAAALLCMLCAAGCLKLPDPRARSVAVSGQSSLRVPAGWLGSLVLIIVLVQSAKVMQQPFYALYVAEVLGGTPAVIGLTYAISAAGLMLSAPLWGKLFDRRAPARTLQVIEQVTWLCAVTLAVAAMANQWAPFIASRLLWGVWQGALLPVAYALIATTLPASRQGFALGVGNSAAKAGGLVGIFIGGIGVSVVGLSNSFWMVVVTYAIAALAIRLVRSNHPLPTLSSHSNNNP